MSALPLRTEPLTFIFGGLRLRGGLMKPCAAQITWWQSSALLQIVLPVARAGQECKIYYRIPCWKINSVACWPQNTWLYSKHVVVRTDSNSFKVLQFSYHSFITPPGNWRVSVSVTFLNCSVLCSSKSEIQARQQTAQSHQIKHQMEEKTLTQR